MAVEKACKKCQRLIRGDMCPMCKESDLTPNWKGYVLIINIEKSEIAKMLDIDTPGKYALRLGK